MPLGKPKYPYTSDFAVCWTVLRLVSFIMSQPNPPCDVHRACGKAGLLYTKRRRLIADYARLSAAIAEGNVADQRRFSRNYHGKAREFTEIAAAVGLKWEMAPGSIINLSYGNSKILFSLRDDISGDRWSFGLHNR
jgi:hypothetical protein